MEVKSALARFVPDYLVKNLPGNSLSDHSIVPIEETGKEKRKLRLLIILAGLFFICFFMSCSTISRKVASGATDGLHDKKEKLDSLVKDLTASLVNSASNTFLSDSIQNNLKIKIGRIVSLMGDSVNNMVGKLRQDQLKPLLKDIGIEVDSISSSLKEKFIGEGTSAWIKELISASLDTVLLKLDTARADLLGEKTRIMLDTLIDRVFRDVDKSYNEHLKGNVSGVFSRADESLDNAKMKVEELSKRLTHYLITFSIIVAALCLVVIYFYFRARRHRETIKVISKQIDDMPDQRAYDQLVNNIKVNAENAKVEENLQSILDELKLKNKQKWKDDNLMLLDLISKELNNKSAEQKGELLRNIEEKAKAANLKSFLDNTLSRNKN